MVLAKALLPEVAMARDAYAAAEGADAVVIVTEWDAFRALDFAKLGRIMRGKVLVDLRNIYDPDEVRAAGFTSISVGRV
jgi:UDPglucose 6-dehydrogenase